MKPMVMANTDAEFEAADQAVWTEMARRILKGAAPDSLDRTDEDGLVTRALYPVDAPDARAATAHLLPAFPHRRLVEGWQVCQPVGSDAANADIHEALGSGATALLLQSGAPAEIGQLLDDVVLTAVGLGLEGEAATPAHYRTIIERANAQGEAADRLDLDAGLDVLTQADEGLALHAAAPAGHRLFRIDGWAQHNLGLTAAQELGYVLAGVAELFRAAESAGIAPADIAGRVSVRLALPADMFAGIAACRAMRRLWDGILLACGIDPVPVRIEGFASLRMMSVLDHEVNMLRTTTALLGGAIGGADAMAGFGHDLLTGETPGARRTARLAQVLMMAESEIARSLDPAAGAPFIESRTDDLADAGWSAFQEIECAGGLTAAIKAGMIQAQAAAAATAREARMRAGEELLGVTLQPTGGMPPEILAAFSAVRRPAACVEALRRRTAEFSPRILILRGATDNAVAEERGIRRWLGMAGLQAVTLDAGSGSAVSDARPDIVIGCGLAALPEGVEAGNFRSAAAILEAGDRIAALEDLLVRKGDAR